MLPFKIPASSDHRCVWIKGEVPCNENNYVGKYLFFLSDFSSYSGPDSTKGDDDDEDDDDDDDEISITHCFTIFLAVWHSRLKRMFFIIQIW